MEILQNYLLFQGLIMKPTAFETIVKLVFTELAGVQVVLVDNILISVPQDTEKLIIYLTCP